MLSSAIDLNPLASSDVVNQVYASRKSSIDLMAKNGRSELAMLNNPASADKITGAGIVGISEVLPTPAAPYTSSFMALAVAWPVFCRLIILALPYRVWTIPFAISVDIL